MKRKKVFSRYSSTASLALKRSETRVELIDCSTSAASCSATGKECVC